jgi:sodium/bile acid cotransporter 7
MTPLLVSLLLHNSGEALSLGQAIINIGELLVVPFALGQLLRPVLGRWFARFKKYTHGFDRAVILLLVYSSFSDSVESGLWTNYGYGIIVTTLAGAALILGIVLCLTTWAAHRCAFSRDDEIVAIFCGSKKTLASGIPMAKLLFGAHPGLGLIVLPIMFYHQLQLAVCTVLAGRYRDGKFL